jgi:hypothetical protein
MQDNLEVRSNLQEAMSTTTALAVVDRITTLALSAFNARVKYEELAAVVEGERSKRRDAERIAAQAQEQMRGARESTLQFANERDKAFKAMKMGTMDAGTAPILEAVAGKGAADTDLIGDETNDRLREFIAINERFLEIGRQQAAGLQAVKAADASGREVVIPTGKQAAPANEREVKRTPIR